MLGWIFRKKTTPAVQAPAVRTAAPAPSPAPPAPAVDWSLQVTQARGDDAALLALARQAGVPVQVKQAAIEALDGEAALKLAEREFRNHDRRVHQLVKRRLLAKSAQRRAREQAEHLLLTAGKLLGDPDVAVNQGVALDRAWQALDAADIESEQHQRFAALSAQLAAQMRQRSDTEHLRKQRQMETARAARSLQTACTDAAAGVLDRAGLAAAVDAASRVIGASEPEGVGVDAGVDAGDEGGASVRRVLQIAAALDQHLAVLDGLLGVVATAAMPDDAATTASITSPDELQRQWHALAPLPDAHLSGPLQARFVRWQQAQEAARQDRLAQRRAQTRQGQRARREEQDTALSDALSHAETALETGQLADAQRLLTDAAMGLHDADAPDALRVRLAAAQAQLSQLRGWQHWAGIRARDELVAQAEALAAATIAGPSGQDTAASEHADRAVEPLAEVERLSIRQRAEVVASMRARWKELDRLGDAGGRALWKRFDAALTAAMAPVAVQSALQRAARESNLAARQQLLDALEAQGGEAIGERPAIDESATKGVTEARPLVAALARFRTEWRKLGPVEHTVPRSAQASLLQRMESVVQRIEAPLQNARRQARAEREALVARAQSLAGEAAGGARHLLRDLQALQAEWQRQAKALPLARDDEQLLWTDFRRAIDAAFAARDAAFSERDLEFEANAAQRQALIEQLVVQPALSPAALQRTLVQVDAAWQRCGPAPRARAAALDAEFGAARAALRRWIDDAAQRDWQAVCDALDAKLALCVAHEQNNAHTAADDVATTWAALPALPAPFEDALRQRMGLTTSAAGGAMPSVDDLLLDVEAAWHLQTPPAFEAARRDRKLQAMKVALEGRRAPSLPAVLSPDAALALLLRQGHLDPMQQGRLGEALAAWRRRGPQAGVRP